MELRCHIYESGYPMSVDADLYPYEVISVIDELETVLNPKGTWDNHTLTFLPNEATEYYYVSTKRYADYLVIVCEDRKTREPKPIPEHFLQKWVYPQVPWNIHPDNYGLSPRSRKWLKVTVRFTLEPVADDNSLRTTSPVSEQEHSK
jgi:hypothetical protein